MICQEFVELVTAYLEGDLDEAGRAEFEEHLQQCPGCDRYLDQFRSTIALVGELPEESISEPVRARLLDAFADWRREGPAVF